MTDGRDRYSAYVASAEYRRSRSRKAQVVAHLFGDYLRGTGHAADLGSGTGLIKTELERLTGKLIIGIELDRDFIAESSRTIQADVTCLPLRSNSLECVLLNHLYEHVADQVALFAEAYRVLVPGGMAYVAAGSRRAIIEPHYRLPFLSWLPAAAANRYVRWSGRGRSYEGIRFLAYRPLRVHMRSAGFMVRDITERAIDELIDAAWGRRWARAWRGSRLLPGSLRSSLLRALSPQWFFLLEKPRLPSGPGEESGVANGMEARR